MATIERQYRKMLERAEQTKARMQKSGGKNAVNKIAQQDRIISHLKKRIQQLTC